MKPLKFCLMAAVLWVALTTTLRAQTNVPTNNAPVKLALVTESSDAEPAADLLTAALSGDDKIQLLERDQIEKVYQEQALSAANTDYLKLGRLLGADGLLLAQIVQERDGSFLTLRLVAVKPGVILAVEKYAWPIKDLDAWSTGFTRRLDGFLLKMAVPPESAIPLSIVNFRSAISSADATETEQTLKLLSIERLSQEGRLFVLERRKLELAAEEKDLSGDNAAFWDGSYLLEGTVDQNGYSPSTITIDARLTPPRGGVPMLFQVSGSRTNLAEVVNTLAMRVTSALQVKPTVPAWSAADEAEQYLEEAKWAWRCHSYEEMLAAADSAWALGNQLREVAVLRIQAGESIADDPGICVNDGTDQHISYGSPTDPRAHIMQNLAAFGYVPAPERFASLVQAAKLYDDSIEQPRAPAEKLGADWLDLGEHLLDQLSLWLRYYYFTAEARAGAEDKIEMAKELCLRITRSLESYPELNVLDAQHIVLKLKARHVAFWTDSPEQTLKIYQDLLARKDWPVVRTRFFNDVWFETNPEGATTTMGEGIGSFWNAMADRTPGANLSNPPLAAWKWADRARCSELWNHLVDQWAISPQPLTALEGQILKCSDSWSAADFTNNLSRLLEFVREEHLPLLTNGIDTLVSDDLVELVQQRASRLNDLDKPETQTNIALAKQVFADLEKEAAAAQLLQERRPALLEKIHYLDTQTAFDFRSFASQILNEGFLPEEARELLPHLEQYQTRLKQAAAPDTNVASATPPKFRADLGSEDFFINIEEKNLNDLIHPPAPSTAPIHAFIHPPVIPPTMALTSTNPVVTPLTAPALVIKRFWVIPTPPGVQDNPWNALQHHYVYGNDTYCPQILASHYRDGDLWLEVRYDMEGFQDKVEFIKLDLQTLAVEIIPLPFSSGLPDLLGTMHAFDVHAGYIYVAWSHAIRRYDLQTGAWEIFPVPSEGTVPQRLGDRLFFTSGSSILEYHADGSFRTLASTKRLPAKNLLDSLPDYDLRHLFLAHQAKLRACIHEGVYELADDGQTWDLIGTLPRRYGFGFFPFEDGFIAESGIGGSEWWGMLGKASQPAYLFHQHEPYSRTYYATNDPDPYWLRPNPSVNCWSDAGCLWFLNGSPKFQKKPDGHLQIQSGTDGGLSLIRFKYGEDVPLTIPLRFDPEGFVIPLEAAAAPISPTAQFGNHQWQFEWTPQGLVMYQGGEACLWVVSAEELAQATSRNAAILEAQKNALATEHQTWRNEINALADKNPEAIITNSHYLELELSNIDTNHNGLLEGNELRYFDVNHNGRLDPSEEIAIEKTVALLAGQLLARCGPDANGRIYQDSLPHVLLSEYPAGIGAYLPVFSRTDGKTELAGVEQFLWGHVYHTLRAARPRTAATWRPMPMMLEPPMDPKVKLKEQTENYWRLTRPNGPDTTAATQP